MTRPLSCGIAGFGFIGPHHADAIRRLGFVTLAGICTTDASAAAKKAVDYHAGRAYDSYAAMLADPGVDVVDIVTPTHLHFQMAKDAIAAGKHVIVDKPLALSSAHAAELLDAARRQGVVHAVTFNYRHNAMVQQARRMIARGELGRIHLVTGHYLQEWLSRETDFNWRVDISQTGEAAMMGDAGCHWFDLAEYVTGLRVADVLADFTTTIAVRKTGGCDYPLQVPDRGVVLLRFHGGARGVFSTSALCPGHKNDLRIEVNGLNSSMVWEQETPESLWIGKRDEADLVLRRDPGLLDPELHSYAPLPGGHGEAWPDAFRNLMREIFTFIACGRAGEPNFPTFVDGLRSARIVEAMLKSSRSGGVWTSVNEGDGST